MVLLQQPNNICILRLSAIGDVCHAIAAVQAIQSHYPRANITWVIGKVEADLVSGLPGVNLVVFDKKQGKTAYKNLKETFKHVEFDVLLHMQVALRVAVDAVRPAAQAVFDAFDLEAVLDILLDRRGMTATGAEARFG